MPLKQSSTARRNTRAANFAADAVSYRLPQQITHMILLPNGTSYPVCPRCDTSIDREYMAFCDRCGQRLSWKRYPNVCILYAGE